MFVFHKELVLDNLDIDALLSRALGPILLLQIAFCSELNNSFELFFYAFGDRIIFNLYVFIIAHNTYKGSVCEFDLSSCYQSFCL